MRKRILAVLALCVMMLALSSCSHKKEGQEELTVSIPAQKWLLDSIVGDRYNVVAMLDAGSNPETFEPTMQQLMSLQNSVAYFTVGYLDFELSSMPKIRENFPAIEVVNASKGIVPIEGTHAGHAYEEGDDASARTSADPHIWTSLPNARILARNMYEAMLRIDPDGKEYYSARFKALDTALASLNDSVAAVLAPLRGESFLVWHPSLSYFARDYGLKQVSIESAGKEASPAQYRTQLDLAQSSAPLLFFTQLEFDPRQAHTMAHELEIPSVQVAVMQADIPAQIRSITNELKQAASSRH